MWHRPWFVQLCRDWQQWSNVFSKLLIHFRLRSRCYNSFLSAQWCQSTPDGYGRSHAEMLKDTTPQPREVLKATMQDFSSWSNLCQYTPDGSGRSHAEMLWRILHPSLMRFSKSQCKLFLHGPICDCASITLDAIGSFYSEFSVIQKVSHEGYHSVILARALQDCLFCTDSS